MTFREYLKRPPVGELLLVIGVSVGWHVTLGSVLWKVAPGLPWWLTYAMSASSAVAIALALSWAFHRRRMRG